MAMCDVVGSSVLWILEGSFWSYRVDMIIYIIYIIVYSVLFYILLISYSLPLPLSLGTSSAFCTAALSERRISAFGHGPGI